MADLKRVRKVMESVADDCEKDVAKLDGTPFDGNHIAPILGEMYAAIQVLARANIILLDELEKRGPIPASALLPENDIARNEG